MYNEPENIFNASTCGDNCAKWILHIAKEKDITINLRHLMIFDKTKDFDIEVEVLNNNQIVKNMKELNMQAIKFLE